MRVKDSQPIVNLEIEWLDSEGWTPEILQAMIDVLTVWEIEHGLNSGDPRNVTEFQSRSSQSTEK